MWYVPKLCPARSCILLVWQTLCVGKYLVGNETDYKIKKSIRSLDLEGTQIGKAISIDNTVYMYSVFSETQRINMTSTTLSPEPLLSVSLTTNVEMHNNFILECDIRQTGQHERKSCVCSSTSERYLPQLPGHVYCIKNIHPWFYC